MGKIIVIGAGQGGLVAAKHLKKFGHDVVVYEAESRKRGASLARRYKARRFRRSGLNADSRFRLRPEKQMEIRVARRKVDAQSADDAAA